MGFSRCIIHVCFVYAIFCKDQDKDYQPSWSIAGSDIFEYVSDVTNMRCGLYQGPCDPNSVVLQKLVQGSWQEACIIYNNESYKSLNGHIGERGGAGYSPFIKEFTLAFSPALVEDSGLWRCKVNDCPSETVYSNGLEVVISTSLTAGDILISTPAYILLNSPAEYKCTSGRVYPEANVTWDQAGEISEGNPTNGFDGTFYQIENTNTFTFCERDKMDVSCVLQKTSGISWTVRKSADPKPVFAPAVVEGFNASYTHPAMSETLEIFCTGSGSSRAIRWRKDGNTLPDGLFDIETVQISGSFRCEESEALNSTITWIQNDNPTCQDIENHNGKYQCIVTADKDTTDTSRELEILTQHPPILKSSTKGAEAIVDDVITLACEVECAMPTLLTYTWSSEHNRDGLDSDSSTVNIIVMEADFNDTFICTVINSLGSNLMTFWIIELEVDTDNPSSQTTLPQTTPGSLATEQGDTSDLDFGAGIGIGIAIGLTLSGGLLVAYIFYIKNYPSKGKKNGDQQQMYQNNSSNYDQHISPAQYEQVGELQYEDMKATSERSYDNMNQIQENICKLPEDKYEYLTTKGGYAVELATYEDLPPHVIREKNL